jgi:hypothetical protein
MKPQQRIDGQSGIIFDGPTSKGRFAGIELKVLEKNTPHDGAAFINFGLTPPNLIQRSH